MFIILFYSFWFYSVASSHHQRVIQQLSWEVSYDERRSLREWVTKKKLFIIYSVVLIQTCAASSEFETGRIPLRWLTSKTPVVSKFCQQKSQKGVEKRQGEEEIGQH